MPWREGQLKLFWKDLKTRTKAATWSPYLFREYRGRNTVVPIRQPADVPPQPHPTERSFLCGQVTINSTFPPCKCHLSQHKGICFLMGFVVFPMESTDVFWRGWGVPYHKHSLFSRNAQQKAKYLCRLKAFWMKEEHRTTSARAQRISSEGWICCVMLCLGETACLAGRQFTRSASR